MRRSQWIDLTRQLTLREIMGRYQGSLFGIGWSIAQPLLMLTVYTFVFSGIFKARWPGMDSDSGVLFATNLFAGLVIFNFVAECATKAPELIVINANYVKRVVFPLEILGSVTVLAAGFHALIGIALLITFKVIATGSIPLSILSIPLLLIPLITATAGVVWAVSALGVYIRDINILINVGVNLLLFLSPIFYPASAFPERWAPFLSLNPLVWMIEAMRGSVIKGLWPNPAQLFIATILGLAIAYLGLMVFRKAQRGFADVL